MYQDRQIALAQRLKRYHLAGGTPEKKHTWLRSHLHEPCSPGGNSSYQQRELLFSTGSVTSSQANLYLLPIQNPWLACKRCFSETNVKCRQNVREIKFNIFFRKNVIFYINHKGTSGNMGAVLWASQRNVNMILVHIFW